MLLSICIPTYERTKCLKNCLHSIFLAKKVFNFNFEVCISDNASTENTKKIVNFYKKKLNIKFKKNKKNLGLANNILSVVSMAEGKYSWIIGNDDLVLPNTLKILFKILNKKENLDFFFVNSYNLESVFVFRKEQPFNTNQLPKKMDVMSKIDKNFNTKFFNLINPDISWDFLMGMMFGIFKTKKWINNIYCINKENLRDLRIYSNFVNTCVHIKIFAKAFSKSEAFHIGEPLIVTLNGERHWWKNYWDFVEVIRIPEIIDEYRKNGLPIFKYLYCKNYSLRNFLPRLIKLFLNRKKNNGFEYISFKNHILKNLIFPNIYFSLFYYFSRNINKFFKKLFS